MSWSDIGDFVDNKFLGGDAARASRNAGNVQQQAATQAGQNIQKQFDTTSSNFQPYIASGQQNLGILNTGLMNGKFDQGQFSFNPQDVSKDPGYQFALQQGIKGADMGAAARGGVLGGGQQKALANYAGGLASQYEAQDYGQAANTYGINQQNLNNQFGRYSQLAGMGQQATGQLGQFGAQNAQSQADLLTGGAAAQAAGQVGAANARSSALTGLLNTGAQLAPMLLL